MECPTVKVASPVSDDNPHGYIVINESDLTEDHEVFEEAASETSDGEPAGEVPAKRKYTKKTDK
ncbi:hypothetical protein [Pararobbsia alpina]|uniref:Uncharacterized protein n=1 Tax=Pararobbsia alpina TaxID=621374 RepID=A0A6S7BAD7_9BURK|nr:hypothetical protein [Pararobbsia alpina]CAB3784357.1 hypothetical protein LMG28138_01793 [Pararobbsia alpina]